VAHFFKQTLLNNNGYFLLNVCLRWNTYTRYAAQLHYMNSIINYLM